MTQQGNPRDVFGSVHVWGGSIASDDDLLGTSASPPNRGRIAASQRTDAKGQQPTLAPQQTVLSFDHSVGAAEWGQESDIPRSFYDFIGKELKLIGDCQPERPSGLHVDHELELGWLNNGQIAGPLTLEDATNVDSCLTMRIG